MSEHVREYSDDEMQMLQEQRRLIDLFPETDAIRAETVVVIRDVMGQPVDPSDHERMATLTGQIVMHPNGTRTDGFGQPRPRRRI